MLPITKLVVDFILAKNRRKGNVAGFEGYSHKFP